MEKIFVLISDRDEWEDLIIYIEEKEAITASQINPTKRVEIFEKTKEGFKPSYKFYKDGKLQF